MAYLASDLVHGALRLAGVIDAGQTPNADQANEGFIALQQLLSAWSADELALFSTRTASVAVSSGVNSYAIPGARPVKILNADVQTGGMTWPVDVLGPDDWAELPNKLNASPRPRALYCDYAYPTPAVTVAPVPNATCTLNLYCLVDLAALATQSTTFDMPEAYADAIRFNLAARLIGEYDRLSGPRAQVVLDTAKDTREGIRKMNGSNRARKPAAS